MQRSHFFLFVLALIGTTSAFADRRMDCRFHSTESSGPKFCYASVQYSTNNNDGAPSINQIIQISNFGVGCDGSTLYNDLGRYSSEATLDRISPSTSATPAIEVLPQYAMQTTGTYDSWLDVDSGRIRGLCYVSEEILD